MQVDVQVGGRAEALDQGDGTGGGLIALEAGLPDEERGNRPMNDLQYRREQFKVRIRSAHRLVTSNFSSPWVALVRWV